MYDCVTDCCTYIFHLHAYSSPSHRLDASGSSGGHMSSITPTNTGTLMSPGPAGVGMHSGSVAPVDHPTPRMFGDTLHLHRSSANAKQVAISFTRLYVHLHLPNYYYCSTIKYKCDTALLLYII